MAYNLLKGKRGIIFGALNEHSIAWKIAERAHEEGATFVLTNAPIALRMGELNALAEKTLRKRLIAPWLFFFLRKSSKYYSLVNFLMSNKCNKSSLFKK